MELKLTCIGQKLISVYRNAENFSTKILVIEIMQFAN